MKFRTPFIYLHFFLLSLLICTIFAEYFCGGIVDFINITIAIFFVILIIFPDFRVIELAEKGCIVRLFNIRKKIRWEDMVYVYRDVVSTRTDSIEGIFFSTKLCRKSGKKITASYIQHSLDIFNCFCIFWMDEKEKEKVLNQLKEWGVEVITSPKLAEKEAYEQKLAEKINLREQSKKLYKKEINKFIKFNFIHSSKLV